jgi:hypothetical protein
MIILNSRALFQFLIIVASLIVVVSFPTHAKLQNEALTLHTIDVDGVNQSY